MPENYTSFFQPAWLTQGSQQAIQQRLGIAKMTDKEKRQAQEVTKEIDNPGYLASVKTGKENALWRSIGAVEQNPGLKPMGEVVDPSILYYIPGVGDALLATDVVSNTLQGNYGDAALAAGLLAAPSAVGGAGKAVAKTATKLDEPLHVYSAYQLGKKPGRGRPASSLNPATGQAITMQNVVDAMNGHGRQVLENTTEEAVEAVAKKEAAKEAAVKSAAKRKAVNDKAGYSATIQKQDRKLARKKDPGDRVRGQYNKTKETVKSVKPEFDASMGSYAAQTFQLSGKVPAGTDPMVHDFGRWIEHLSKEFDVKSRVGRKEAERAFNQIFGHRFNKKQGGILNYATYFK